MAQYTTGTVTVKTNSATVWGASTTWNTANNVEVGDLFKQRGQNAWYQVTAVNNATNMNISPVFAAASVAGVNYIVSRDFTPVYSWPEISAGDYDWQDCYTRALRAIDAKIAGGAQTVQTLTASYHVQLGDTFLVASVSGTASAYLPNATPARRISYTCKAGDIAVVASSGDTIAGDSSKTLTTDYEAETINSDGVSTWYIV